VHESRFTAFPPLDTRPDPSKSILSDP